MRLCVVVGASCGYSESLVNRAAPQVQAYVKQVTQQVENKILARAAPKTKEQIATEEAKKAKAAAAAAEKELQALLRSTVKQPKLGEGVDPKSVVCEYFKAGVCDKGAYCSGCT